MLEKINDPDFKVVELDALNAEAGSGSFNIRDQAIVEQLIGLAHLESINAELIRQGLGQSARLPLPLRRLLHHHGARLTLEIMGDSSSQPMKYCAISHKGRSLQ